MKKLSTEDLVNSKDINKLQTEPRSGVYLILDNIRSMYNVGAIFRTADAARVEKIYLCGITATPPRKEIEKTALKTIEYVPWEYATDTRLKIKDLKKQGIQIIALEQTNKSINYKEFSYQKPCAIVIGHEVDGVSDDVLALCDAAIEIPMLGISNSLNVATATGVILYGIIGR